MEARSKKSESRKKQLICILILGLVAMSCSSPKEEVAYQPMGGAAASALPSTVLISPRRLQEIDRVMAQRTEDITRMRQAIQNESLRPKDPVSAPVPPSNGIRSDHWNMRLKLYRIANRYPTYSVAPTIPDFRPLNAQELSIMAILGLRLSTQDLEVYPSPLPGVAFSIPDTGGNLVNGWREGSWKDYDRQGNLIGISEWKNGNIQ